MATAALPIALVGESFFQPAIAACRDGDDVDVLHESDNPYDDRALIVKTPAGAAIGYAPRESFLQRALLDEAQGCRARIRAIVSRKGKTGVVIEVELLGRASGPVATCTFEPR